MIKLADYRTEKALPAEMRTPERIALSYAYDQQKKKFLERLRRIYIWADLENVDDNKLDFLAVENRVLFYSAEFTPDIKRKLITNAIYWYIKLGTRQAMEEFVATIFGTGKVKEWFNYGGNPFFFKIWTDALITKENIELFMKIIHTVKNARSRFEGIELNREYWGDIYSAGYFRTQGRSVIKEGDYGSF